MNIQDLAAWVGRQERCDDNIDIGHVGKIALSLDAPAPAPGDALPLLWQWALFVHAVPYKELGADGHPRRGGFLPPADDRNRMWAGGRVRFLQPLRGRRACILREWSVSQLCRTASGWGDILSGR